MATKDATVAVLFDGEWFQKAVRTVLDLRWALCDFAQLSSLAAEAVATGAWVRPRPGAIRFTGGSTKLEWYDAPPPEIASQLAGRLSTNGITPRLGRLSTKRLSLHHRLHSPLEQWISDSFKAMTADEEWPEPDITHVVAAAFAELEKTAPCFAGCRDNLPLLAEILRKRLVERIDNAKISRQEQKGVDVQLALNIVELASAEHIRDVVIASGDDDFTPAIGVARNEARRLGKEVGFWLLLPQELGGCRRVVNSFGLGSAVAPGLANAVDGEIRIPPDRLAALPLIRRRRRRARRR